MSQRLHIGKTDKEFYDCVIVDTVDVREKLITEWLVSGPLKISIGDVELFEKIEPIIKEAALETYGWKYPDGIWRFYKDGRSIDHPTKAELSEWLSAERGK